MKKIITRINRKNNRWLCSDITEVPIVMATNFQPLGRCCAGHHQQRERGHAVHFFPKGLTINAEEYVKVLRDIVKLWIDWVASGRHYIFQQDGAPAHNAKKTQYGCEANLLEFWLKEIWPPSSPNCNPLDYYIWSVCELDVNKVPHNTAALLIAKITEVMATLPRASVALASRLSRRSIEAVVEAGGNFFE
jgi:hypothetical protein